MAGQPVNNTEITYYNAGKTSGNAVLPLFIVDILVTQWAKKVPVTITEIKAELLERGLLVGRATICRTIDNINRILNTSAWLVHSEIVRRGRTKTAAFYIQFNSEIQQ